MDSKINSNNINKFTCQDLSKLFDSLENNTQETKINKNITLFKFKGFERSPNYFKQKIIKKFGKEKLYSIFKKLDNFDF